MRIGDWCSDVCSSDLFVQRVVLEADETVERQAVACQAEHAAKFVHIYGARASRGYGLRLQAIEPLMQWRVVDAGKNGLYLYLDADRQSVVEGKGVSVSVDLVGRRIIKKKKT